MPHKLLIFMKRRPGLSVAEFRDYYEQRHVPLCMPYMAGAERYRRRYVEPAPGAAELDFDVVTEVWLPSAGAVQQVMATMAADAMPAEIIADEARFLDRARSRWCAVTEEETALG